MESVRKTIEKLYEALIKIVRSRSGSTMSDKSNSSDEEDNKLDDSEEEVLGMTSEP